VYTEWKMMEMKVLMIITTASAAEAWEYAWCYTDCHAMTNE